MGADDILSGIKVHMTFKGDLIREPVISRLISETGVVVNIRRANVDENVGWMICQLSGEPSCIESALIWLSEHEVEVNRLADVVES